MRRIIALDILKGKVYNMRVLLRTYNLWEGVQATGRLFVLLFKRIDFAIIFLYNDYEISILHLRRSVPPERLLFCC